MRRENPPLLGGIEETVLDVEGKPSVGAYLLHRVEKGAGGYVAETEGCHAREAVELPIHELLFGLLAELGEILDVVVIVNLGSITMGGRAGLWNDVCTHKASHASVFKFFRHHAVTSSKVEDAEFGERLANRLQSALEKFGNLSW